MLLFLKLLLVLSESDISNSHLFIWLHEQTLYEKATVDTVHLKPQQSENMAELRLEKNAAVHLKSGK